MTGPSLLSRLADLVADLGAAPTPELLERLCRGAVELLGARGSGYCVLDDDDLVVAATWQLPEGLVGQRFPYAGTALDALVRGGGRSLVAEAADFPAFNEQVYEGRGGGLAVARTEAAGRLSGGLYVAMEPGDALSPAELEVLELLAAHAGVALHDAERVAVAERLRRRTEEAKDLFLAVAGHELRTPLTVLRGFGDTLLHRWDAFADEERRELVRTVVARTAAMTELVEQLMRGTQAGAGSVAVDLRAFDLASEVRRVVRSVDGSSPDHPMRLDAPEPVTAHGDPSKVEPVLGQLLENAVKYSPDGGAVDVAVRAEPGWAVLTVADRGVGIAPDDLDRVFDRFVRGGGATASRSGGVGLGLWIVRRYVEAQGGAVTAAVRPEGGTLVEVRLPASS